MISRLSSALRLVSHPNPDDLQAHLSSIPALADAIPPWVVRCIKDPVSPKAISQTFPASDSELQGFVSTIASTKIQFYLLKDVKSRPLIDDIPASV